MGDYLRDRNRNRRSFYVFSLVTFGFVAYSLATNIIPNIIEHLGESKTIEEVVQQNGNLESAE